MNISLALRALCAAALIVTLPTLARAATPTPSPAPTPLHTVAHVVTADRSNETLRNVIRTTFVVTRAQIVRNGWSTVGDALADVPGVQISHYGAIGSGINFGLRGSSSAQTLVLIDGMPAPGSFSGSVGLSTLSTQNVDHIEIVEGGGSTLYGTGAIGGIINVITRTRHFAPAASVTFGSFGDTTTRIAADGFSFERISATNAFSLPMNTNGLATQPNADYRETTLAYGSAARLRSLDATWHVQLENDELGAPGPFGYTSLTSREQDRNATASFSLTRTRGAASTTLVLGGSRQTIGYGCSATDPNCYQTTQSINIDSRVSLGLRHTLDLASTHLVYGIDLARGVARTDSGGAIPGSVVTNPFAQTAAYVQDRLLLNKRLQVAFGLRGERDGRLGGEFSPSVGMLARLTNDLTIKGNYASAFRAPNASELYFPGYGNPTLVAERARVADISLVNDALLGGATLTWFSNTTHNLIVPTLVDPANFIYQAQNLDLATIRGVTFALRTRPLHGFSSSVDITDLYSATDATSGTRLSNDPVFNVGLGLDYRAGKRGIFDDAGIRVQSVGARGTVDPSKPLFDQPAAYSQANAYARFRLGQSAMLALRVTNLGNERFAQIAGYPMPGRAFSLELSTR